MYKKLTQIETMNTFKSENCGLQLEGENFKAFQLKPFEYVNIQFHRVIGVVSVNWTLIKRNYKGPQLHEIMTSKPFKDYRSKFA